MTTATRNEAAERLREWILRSQTIGGEARPLASLDEALAAERRATVERIKKRLIHTDLDDGVDGSWDFLNEEAAR